MGRGEAGEGEAGAGLEIESSNSITKFPRCELSYCLMVKGREKNTE